jgi:hypothetical protein
MRKLWCMTGLLGAMLWMAGCKNEALLRPPKNPEVFNLPPDDPRYTGPPEYPKDTLNQDPLAKAKSDSNLPGGKSGGMGSMKMGGGP